MADDDTTTEETEGNDGGNSGDSGKDFDADRAMATIKVQRQELKEYRATAAKERDALQAKLKEYEDAKLSDDEKKDARIKELEARESELARTIQTQDLRLGVYSLVGELKIADADLAIAALDLSQVQWDGAGKPENLRELVTELLERKPLLKAAGNESEDDEPEEGETPTKKTASSNAGSGSGGKKPPALTADEVEMAKRMGVSPEQYARNKSIDTVDDYLATLKKT